MKRWLVVSLASASVSLSTSPLSVAPSQYWDGNDGPWSTFGVQIGTPAQNLRLLPHTGESSIWVVLPEGCTPDDPPDCPDSRGFTFKRDRSSTWDRRGLFHLLLYVESKLGYHGNALYGNDTVRLGWDAHASPDLSRQVVAGIATKDFYLGALGLDVRPFNFTNLNNPLPSALGSLIDSGRLASASWAYTAGSFRNVPPAFGSLTLGGYDRNRFVPNDITFPFGPDISQDLLLAIQRVETDAADAPLLDDPVFAFIDSVVPHIWLPRAACDSFERAFNLTYDDGTGLYLISDHAHTQLVQRNPSIAFTLGAAVTGGPTITIQMPYASFDLTLEYPFIPAGAPPQRYFPIRRAGSDFQITLGRAFLQNAYIVVDYDRSSFTVAQAVLPSSAAVPQDLVAIQPPDASARPAEPSDTSSLSIGAIAGIAVGAVVLVTALLAVFFLHRRRRRRRGLAEPANIVSPTGLSPADENPYAKAELDSAAVAPGELAADGAKAKPEVAGGGVKVQSADGQDKVELEAEPPPSELGSDGQRFEAMARNDGIVHELPAWESIAELESPLMRNQEGET